MKPMEFECPSADFCEKGGLKPGKALWGCNCWMNKVIRENEVSVCPVRIVLSRGRMEESDMSWVPEYQKYKRDNNTIEQIVEEVKAEKLLNKTMNAQIRKAVQLLKEAGSSHTELAPIFLGDRPKVDVHLLFYEKEKIALFEARVAEAEAASDEVVKELLGMLKEMQVMHDSVHKEAMRRFEIRAKKAEEQEEKKKEKREKKKEKREKKKALLEEGGDSDSYRREHDCRVRTRMEAIRVHPEKRERQRGSQYNQGMLPSPFLEH